MWDSPVFVPAGAYSALSARNREVLRNRNSSRSTRSLATRRSTILCIAPKISGNHPWEKWKARIIDWQRTYCRLLFQKDDRDREQVNAVGRFWSIVRMDLEPSDDRQKAAFNRWYDETHIPEVCSGKGFVSAWRLMVVSDSNDLGPREQEY